MEETIGYEALFSSTEWNAIVTGDWSLLDDEEEESSSDGPSAASSDDQTQSPEAKNPKRETASSGAVGDGSGCAARSSAAAPEGSSHIVDIREVFDGYELSCRGCDFFDIADGVIEADNLARLHEEFTAVMIARYEVGS